MTSTLLQQTRISYQMHQKGRWKSLRMAPNLYVSGLRRKEAEQDSVVLNYVLAGVQDTLTTSQMGRRKA